MPSAVSICNEALAEIAADSIASVDEESVAATECRRALDNVIADLLERSDWGFKTRRISGSPVTNDRASEWNYAYSRPAAASKIMRVLLPIETDYPEWNIHSPPIQEGFGAIPFAEVSGNVYTNVEDALLEYSLATVDVSAFPPLFRRAVVAELAARISYPIKKDRQLRGDLIQLSEIATARAIADDQNRQPRRRDFISQAELARNGIPC